MSYYGPLTPDLEMSHKGTKVGVNECIWWPQESSSCTMVHLLLNPQYTTTCAKLFATPNEMPEEAIWRHTMQENTSAAGVQPRTPLGELTALLQTL